MDENGKDGLAIEVRGLNKSFGRTQVLRNLDLELRWGEVLTVLGPNGSGKTTLINALCTLAKPDSGVVRVGGFDAARAGRAVRRAVGVVTHEAMLYEQLTGRENLTFAVRMFGLDRAGERVRRAAVRMGVEARLDQRVGAMSHGLRKRFGIARALVHDPSVLLLDEPESGLDAEALALLDEVIASHSSPARAVLMTTHNRRRGLALGDRAVTISGGRMQPTASLNAETVAAARIASSRRAGRPA